jgi:hypothetical protein
MTVTTFGLNDAPTVKLWSVSFFNQVCGNTATSGTGLTPKFILNSCARPDLSAPGFFMRASAPAGNRAGRFCTPRPLQTARPRF